jgi:hypothetical protein
MAFLEMLQMGVLIENPYYLAHPVRPGPRRRAGLSNGPGMFSSVRKINIKQKILLRS